MIVPSRLNLFAQVSQGISLGQRFKYLIVPFRPAKPCRCSQSSRLTYGATYIRGWIVWSNAFHNCL